MSTLFYADDGMLFSNLRFENDVKMNGTQTTLVCQKVRTTFENDVKMNGTQTVVYYTVLYIPFENDVKMNGTQTRPLYTMQSLGLRMM